MIALRRLVREDEARWRALWAGFLDFYNTPLAEAVTAKTFQRLVDDDRFFALIAEKDGAPAGFAHCLFHPATWAIGDYGYLEDLYVAPNARGEGAGRALIEAVYAEADRRGAERVYWHTDAGNRPARRLYDKLATISDFVQYRRA